MSPPADGEVRKQYAGWKVGLVIVGAVILFVVTAHLVTREGIPAAPKESPPVVTTVRPPP